MAKPPKNFTPSLPRNTELDVIATKNGVHHKLTMTIEKWSGFKKARGWNYKAFQKGFSQFKITPLPNKK